MTALGDARTAQPAAGARAFRRVLGGVTVFFVVYVAWLAFKLGGADVTHVFNDLAGTAAALGAGAVCWWASRTQSGGTRRSWTLLSLATLSWGLGEATWTFYELVLKREVPFPSFADVGYLAFVPLAVAGMLTVSSAPARMSGRIRTFLDGSIAAGSLLFVSWALQLGPMFRDASEPLFTKVIGLSYPVGDIAIAATALPFIVRLPRGQRSPLMWLTTGLLVLAAADSLFAYLTLNYEYQTGGPLDALWLGAFLLIGLGAFRRTQSRAAPGFEATTPSLLRAMIPSATVLPALAIAMTRALSGQPLGPFLTVTGIALLGLLAVRQIMTIDENLALAREFEAQVLERTRELKASEELSRGILQTANDAFISIDGHGNIVDWNTMAEEVFGWTFAEVRGRPLRDVVGPAVRVLYSSGRIEQFLRRDNSVETIALHRDGRSFPVEVTSWTMHSGNELRMNVFVRDISERKAFEERLAYQTLHDSLTGLPNRALFEDRVTHVLARMARDGRRPSVLFVDIDDFKTVNDSLGYQAGDEVLIAVAHRLASSIRQGDTVARIGADRFAILIENPPVTDEAVAVAQRLIDAVKEPLSILGRSLTLRCSVGIAAATDHADAGTLISFADTALTFAKAGGDSVASFSPEMHASTVARLDLETDLQGAMERDELRLVYQPIFSIDTGHIRGVEALLRWEHPERGLVGPAEFVPVAEATGLIVPIGSWAMEQACAQLVRWRRRHSALDLRMSVNLSIKQLDDPELAGNVRRILGRTEMPADALILEVTESVLTADSHAMVQALHDIRRLGVRIAMDDFGTGYSSLGYLRRLPVDILKIDKSFVDGVAASEEDAALIRGIVGIGRTLDLAITAEGIETHDQLAALKRLGCDYGQGYLFSRPVAAESIEQMLNEPAMSRSA